ncbi:MAG TPA: DUF2489 domain-containing protein [Pyrinomonadaceae bacterium]|nr:DUF2489 domain-containing protein [Pyrinomonadaceae bacterium]
MKHEEYFIRGKIVAICEAVVAEEIGIIAASRRLSALGLELFHGRHEDFITFDAVDSETDHFPVDTERKNWSAEALRQKDEEIAEAEALYRTNVIASCRKLLERFAIDNRL